MYSTTPGKPNSTEFPLCYVRYVRKVAAFTAALQTQNLSTYFPVKLNKRRVINPLFVMIKLCDEVSWSCNYLNLNWIIVVDKYIIGLCQGTQGRTSWEVPYIKFHSSLFFPKGTNSLTSNCAEKTVGIHDRCKENPQMPRQAATPIYSA